MTTWSIPAVGEFAGRAGWRGDDLAVAVTVAMRASHGDDHAIVLADVRGATWGYGLWTIQPEWVDGLGQSPLFDPFINAGAAAELWQANGRDWLWHPSAGGPGFDADVAAVLDALNDRRQATGTPLLSSVPGQAARTGGVVDALRDVAERAASLSRVIMGRR